MGSHGRRFDVHQEEAPAPKPYVTRSVLAAVALAIVPSTGHSMPTRRSRRPGAPSRMASRVHRRQAPYTRKTSRAGLRQPAFALRSSRTRLRQPLRVCLRRRARPQRFGRLASAPRSVSAFRSSASGCALSHNRFGAPACWSAVR
jgi:hypothetical protein